MSPIPLQMHRILLLFTLLVSGCASSRIATELKALEFEWVPLEGGSFVMGDTFFEELEDAMPTHPVTLEPFYISKYETTLDQFDWFASKTNRVSVLSGQPDRGSRAAGGMTWDDAVAFCAFIGGRLPSEQEWEYAAAGGTTKQLYPGTDEEGEMDEYVRHRVNSLAESFPVATKKPNAFGLYDMGGNVAEWIAEYYESYPEPGENPVWIDLSTRELRLARGGGFSAERHVARTYWRAGTLKTITTPTIGVRCVKDR